MAVANCGGLRFNKESLKVSNNILTLKDNTSVGDSFVAPMCGGLLLDSNVFAPYRVNGKEVIGVVGSTPTDYIVANCSLLVAKDSFEINERGELVCNGGEQSIGLKFTANTAGSTLKMSDIKGGTPEFDMEVSYNNGASWEAYNLDDVITFENVGDSVLFRGDNPNGVTEYDADIDDYKTVIIFFGTGSIACSGNIMYLIDKTGTRMDVPAHCFVDLFFDNSADGWLTQAPELPATTLADGCYAEMFYGCTSLTQAPELPATTLANSCYRDMFYGCTSLNYIKTHYNGTLPLNDLETASWLGNVSATGDAYFNGTVTDGGTADSIPSGWTIHTF